MTLIAGFCTSVAAQERLKPLVWQAATDFVVVHQIADRLDLRQGDVLADILRDRDIKSVAVTYANSAYGKGLEGAFSTAFKARGGTVAISVSHQDGKTDYFAEMGALAAAGVEHLVVFGHLDRGAEGIIRTALDTGAFEKFVLGDAMVGEALVRAIGDELNGSIATVPGDAAIQPAETMQSDSTSDIVTSNPEAVPPGDLAGAVDIVKSGGAIVLDNGEDVQLTGIGDTSGTYRELEFIDGRFETVKIR
ncbi:MAG: ABC transporter substrate-binding protein [Rhizobiaceae bacterium]